HDRNATLWSSLVLRSPRHAVFFSGDTGLTTEYQTIRERLGPFDLVMLEVGAFHPAWGDIHLGPNNALKALALLGGDRKSTRLNSSHTEIYTLSLHDALPIWPFDLVMLEVGAFHPAWGDIHLGPNNALKALALLG